MAHHPRLLSACVSLLTLAPLCPAQSLSLYDGLNYGVTPSSPGILASQNGGFGWKTPWMGHENGGLIAWWPLDNTANAAGSSGANGVMYNGQYLPDVPSTAVWSTHSLKFTPGQKTYVDLTPHIGRFQNLMSGSITLWVKTTKNTGGGIVMVGATNNLTSRRIELRLQGGKVFYEVGGDLPTGTTINGFTDVADDRWHHVAITVSPGGFATLYIDGNLETSGSEGFFGHVLGLNGMWMGRVQFRNPSRHFMGQLDDVAVWGRCLTQSEVVALADTPPPLTPLPPPVTGPALEPESLPGASAAGTPFGTYNLSPIGNRMSDSNGLLAARQLKDAVRLNANQVRYMSCLMRLASVGTNPGYEVQFTDSGGVHCRFGWDSSLRWLAGFDKTSTGNIIQAGSTYFVVVKIDASSTGNDAIYVKAYAPGETVHADDSVLTTGFGSVNNWTAAHTEAVANVCDVMWLVPQRTGTAVEIDELRMGSTWESVTSLGYGDGCLGLTIDKANTPAIGSSDFEVKLIGASMSQPAFLCVGRSRSIWGAMTLPLDLALLGAPGCEVLASIDTTVATATTLTGEASITLPVPNQSSLVGSALYLQWAAMDAGLRNPLPLAFSDAMEVVFER